jgi:cytochrome b pre-mRNA-processing protein 3
MPLDARCRSISAIEAMRRRERKTLMAFRFLGRARRADTIEGLYGAIVAQARHPLFYADYGVPDTVEARFDMIVLHVALFFRRARESHSLRATGQSIFDRFCKDMEHNLREMGVSDLALPRRMRRIGEAFYGRAAVYEGALACPDDEAIVAALARNVFADDGAPQVRRLAAYVRATAAELARQDEATFAEGMVRFPDPACPNPAAECGVITECQ